MQFGITYSRLLQPPRGKSFFLLCPRGTGKSTWVKAQFPKALSHPKFYFFDVGIFRTLRPTGPLDSPAEAEGIACESLFYQELKALNDYYRLGYDLYYWRTSNNVEVDFILYGRNGIKAFEVKRVSKITGDSLKGLKAFLKEYPKAQTFLIYGGSRPMREGDIEIVPMEAAMKQLPKFLGA